MDPPAGAAVERRPARFPDPAALGKYWTIRSDDDRSQVTTLFSADGLHRRLAFRVTVPQDTIDSLSATTTDTQQWQQLQANGISVTRLAVAKGNITGARGFTIAADKQSAVLNTAELAESLRAGNGNTELYLTWDVAQ